MLNMLLALVVSAALVLVLMPKLLPVLKHLKFEQTIYKLGPKAHAVKQGTPNMGGVLIAGAAMIAAIAFHPGDFSLQDPIWPFTLVSLGSMAIGFADDFTKDVKKRSEGLTPTEKIVGQVLVGALFSSYCAFSVGTELIIPFFMTTWDLGWFYIPVMMVVFIFMTNSSNLQDGVDGLLSSVTVTGALAMGLVCFSGTYYGIGSLVAPGSIFYGIGMVACFAAVGACLGFLRYNRHPAMIFMGDTGSMFIGGLLTAVAMITKLPFLLLFVCLTMIVSSVSVIIQRAYFAATHGKRLFRMSPLHHHFELGGMSENRIVLMYGLVSAVVSAIGAAGLLCF